MLAYADCIGKGSCEVVGVDVLPSREVIDFAPRPRAESCAAACVVAMRAAHRGVNNLLGVLPGTDCEAIDLDLGGDGRIGLLTALQERRGLALVARGVADMGSLRAV